MLNTEQPFIHISQNQTIKFYIRQCLIEYFLLSNIFLNALMSFDLRYFATIVLPKHWLRIEPRRRRIHTVTGVVPCTRTRLNN